MNCRAVLSSCDFDFARFLHSFLSSNTTANLHRPQSSEAKRASGLVQQDYSPEMGWNAELGGRLCFNAESDCGAGDLLVRLQG